jgi:predicted alpha/beta superfamily hydrolase
MNSRARDRSGRRALSLLLLLPLLFHLSPAQTPAVCAGTIVSIDSFRSAYVETRRVDVWLPAGYDAARRYAVIYMHDGQRLFDSTVTTKGEEWGMDETLTRLMMQGKIRNTMVVGIWSNAEARHAEYFPWKPVAVLPDAERESITKLDFNGNPRSDKYLMFLVRELKPYVDARFATLPERENTFVGGSSMGGLIAFYALCEYPDIFGGAACLSPHWIGNTGRHDEVIPGAFRDYLRTHLPDPATHRFYFDHGTVGVDSLYAPGQRMVDDVMRAGGYDPSRWMSREFAGANHSERDWCRRLAIPMEFLLARP